MRSLDNPKLFTEEEKEDSRLQTFDTAYDTSDANAAYAAYATHAYATIEANHAYATIEANHADDTHINVAEVAEFNVKYWIKEFFSRTCEDRQPYIDEVERLR